MKRYAPLIAFLCLACALAAAMLSAPSQTTHTRIVETALPLPTLTLADAQGNPAKLSTANRVTLINVFASWCTPCIADHAQLTQLRDAMPNLSMLGIAWKDAPNHTATWLSTHGNPFRRVWHDAHGEAAIALGVRGVPESFVVDSTGTIRLHITGALDDTLRAELLQRLEAL